MKSMFYIAVLTTMIFAQMPLQEGSQFVTKNLSVEGKVLKHVVLDREQIKQLPQFASKKKPIVCMSGDVKVQPKSFTGVLLKEILDLAKIRIDSKREMNTIYVIVQASDGYKVIFSYHELYNTQVGEKVIVYYKKDGQLLDEKEGDLALISLNDNKNGPRHVKWLEKVIVKSYHQ